MTYEEAEEIQQSHLHKKYDRLDIAFFPYLYFFFLTTAHSCVTFRIRSRCGRYRVCLSCSRRVNVSQSSGVVTLAKHR